jgi:hypothetical protein
MRSAGAGCRLQTCRRGDPQRFNSAFPAMTFGGGRAGNRIPRGALSSVEERPFRIREVEGSNPSVSTFWCARTAVPHTGVDVSNHSVSTFLCAPASCAVVPKRLRGWTRNPLGSARAGSSPADCGFSLSGLSHYRCAVVPKRLRGWTRNPLGSARAGSSPADCGFSLPGLGRHRCADVPKRLRGWTRNPLGSARAGSSPAVCVLLEKLSRRESNPGHPRDRRVY